MFCKGLTSEWPGFREFKFFDTMEEDIMDQYVCSVCGYVYDPADGDPDNGVAPGTSFDDVPDDWACPVCGAGKDMFGKE